MAIVPEIKSLSASSVDILNVIRNNATQNYREYIPQATPNAESIKNIGAIIMDNPSLQNEFLSALVNRIGRVIVTSKTYSNPLAMFKKGMIEMGETIEEIFVNIAKPFQYDPEVAESTVFKREIPDVRSAFHPMNYKKFYKTTVEQVELKQAFLSWDGVTNLISKIVDSMYTAANYDEFQVMKYMLGKHILNGQMYPVTIPTVDTDNLKSVTSSIKGVSNNFEFLSDKYNLAGVFNNTLKSEQYMLVDSNFDAKMDVEVLASAFNMDKAQFMGQRVLVDSFGSIDRTRLARLFENDTTYVPFTDDQIAALNSIPAVIVDRDWFMIFDNFFNFTEQYNGQGLYWNYYYHVWKTFSVSPFANNAVFVPGTPAVNSVTVSPAIATLNAGQEVQLSAKVDTDYFAPQAVIWSLDVDESVAIVSPSGKVTISNDATSATEIVATATSKYDSAVTGTCTITVA